MTVHTDLLEKFVEELCEGKEYDSCKSSPCKHASGTGCTHPQHPRNTAFAVLWVENDLPNTRGFAHSNMVDALKFAEALRQRKYAGENLRFITLASENPDCVGKQGFDVTGPNYDWKKRRK